MFQIFYKNKLRNYSKSNFNIYKLINQYFNNNKNELNSFIKCLKKTELLFV